MQRKLYPSDVSDDKRAFIAPYLTLMTEEATQRALRMREERTRTVSSSAELAEAVETGFARCYWAGSIANEQRIQQELRATTRVIPFEQPDTAGRCIVTGTETTQQVIFARAY